MPSAWDRVEEALRKYYHEPDVDAFRAVCSAYAAHWLSGPPVWPMIVAPPGSLKTEMLNALKELPGIHLIDQITPNTFISGQIETVGGARAGPPSLLHRIGANGVIVFSDFSTVLALPNEKRAAILADMRRIYDGRLRKEFGTASKAGSREWEGRLTFFVAATPDVDRFYSIFQTLGERFVMIRCERAGGPEAALAAMRQNPVEARQELKSAVHALFEKFHKSEPRVPEAICKQVANLAEFLVRGRTHVHRDGYKKDVIYVPEPEAPTRLAQQLAQLSKGSALLDRRSVVSDNDYALAFRVGWDCIPQMRCIILEYAARKVTTKVDELPYATRKYAEEDLSLVGLMVGGGKSVQLSEDARRWLLAAGMEGVTNPARK